MIVLNRKSSRLCMRWRLATQAAEQTKKPTSWEKSSQQNSSPLIISYIMIWRWVPIALCLLSNCAFILQNFFMVLSVPIDIVILSTLGCLEVINLLNSYMDTTFVSITTEHCLMNAPFMSKLGNRLQLLCVHSENVTI